MSSQKTRPALHDICVTSSPPPAVGVRVIPRGQRPQHASATEGRDSHGRQTTRWRDHVPHGGHGAGARVQAIVGLGAEVESANVESLGAAIFHVPRRVACQYSVALSVYARKMDELTSSECPYARTCACSSRTCGCAPGGARSGGGAGGPSCAQTSCCSRQPGTGTGTRACRRASPCAP